jgi:hypothetical protein
MRSQTVMCQAIITISVVRVLVSSCVARSNKISRQLVMQLVGGNASLRRGVLREHGITFWTSRNTPSP